MSIIRNAKQQIVDDINSRNQLDITVDQLDYGKPYPPESEDDLFFAEGRNSVITLTAKVGAPALGRATVYYDRVDLSTVFTAPNGVNPMVVPVDLPRAITTHDIIPAINYYHGLDMSVDDIEPFLVDHENLTVVIQATPGSIGWLGSIVAKLAPGGPQLAQNFPNTESIVPYVYPYYNVKLGSASVYSYPYKFDDYAAELLAAGTGLSLPRLAAIIKAVTGHPWEIWRMPSVYNLKEAVISYNGPNLAELPSNPNSQYVMVVDLSLYCINLGGKLLIHYSDLS